MMATLPDNDVEAPGDARGALPSRQVRDHLVRQAEKVRRISARALSSAQRQELLDAVHQPRFVDRSVPYIYATLLAENHYYGSISTIYRILRSVGEVGERRDQATRPPHVKPELCATGPVYAWDIAKLGSSGLRVGGCRSRPVRQVYHLDACQRRYQNLTCVNNERLLGG